MIREGFAALLLRPFVRGIVGVTVEGELPAADPFLLVANHNSHLDTPVLLSLFAPSRLARVRPVAAADYWMGDWRKRLLARAFNVLPIDRTGAARGELTRSPREPPTANDLRNPRSSDREGRSDDPLAPMREALARGETLILFPEGTRGEPEVMGRFHSGAARLLLERPGLFAVPVHLRNSGRTLPRGTALFVPFIVEVRIGAPLRPSGSVGEIRAALEGAVRGLAELA